MMTGIEDSPRQVSSNEGTRSARLVSSPAPRDVWEEVYRADPFALVSQSPAWVDAMCGPRGLEDASRLYEGTEGRLLVLPLLRRTPAGRALAIEGSYLPGWGYGGLLAPGGVRPEEAAAVSAELAGRRVLRQSVTPNPLLVDVWSAAAASWPIRLSSLAHVLDLEGSFEKVWSSRFHGNVRTGARRAEREGVTVECDTSGRLVSEFYGLLSKSVDRWARQQHEPQGLARWRFRRSNPIESFQALAQGLGERCRIWIARVEDRPAAGIVVLQDLNASYTRGAMDEELARYRANHLLHTLAIEEACRAGCRHYHFGTTGAQTKLAQFKERFGARPYASLEYRHERLPITALNQRVRGAVKRLIGFNEAG
jgi:hypothetical protein